MIGVEGAQGPYAGTAPVRPSQDPPDFSTPPLERLQWAQLGFVRQPHAKAKVSELLERALVGAPRATCCQGADQTGTWESACSWTFRAAGAL